MSSATFGTTPPPAAAANERSHAAGVWWPWLVTFLAFPPAGLVGRAVAGPVEDLPAAVLAGIVTGSVLGTLQWALLRRQAVSPGWILGTAIGFGVGLGAGAALVSHRTDRPSLALMGAVAGLAVGLCQAIGARATTRESVLWGVATAGLWVVGWMLTSGVIDVADQWPVFGASGALAVAFAQSLFIRRVLPIGTVAQTTTRGVAR